MRHRLVRLFRIVRIGPTLQRGGCIRQVPGLAQLPQFHFGEEDGSVLGHISARAAGEASDAPGHRAPMTPPARPLASCWHAPVRNTTFSLGIYLPIYLSIYLKLFSCACP